MELTVQIPDDLAIRMSASGCDLSRRALEALALVEFKSGRITKPELRRLLGFGTRYRLDGFLKSHDVCEDYTMEDFERDREDVIVARGKGLRVTGTLEVLDLAAQRGLVNFAQAVQPSSADNV